MYYPAKMAGLLSSAFGRGVFMVVSGALILQGSKELLRFWMRTGLYRIPFGGVTLLYMGCIICAFREQLLVDYIQSYAGALFALLWKFYAEQMKNSEESEPVLKTERKSQGIWRKKGVFWSVWGAVGIIGQIVLMFPTGDFWQMDDHKIYSLAINILILFWG